MIGPIYIYIVFSIPKTAVTEKPFLNDPTVPCTDKVADGVLFIRSVVGLILEESSQTGIDTDATDALHVFSFRTASVQVDSDGVDSPLDDFHFFVIPIFIGKLDCFYPAFIVTVKSERPARHQHLCCSRGQSQ